MGVIGFRKVAIAVIVVCVVLISTHSYASGSLGRSNQGLSVDEIMNSLGFDVEYNGTSEDAVRDVMDLYKEVYRKKIDEPTKAALSYNHFREADYDRANATLLTLVRNSELEDIVFTVRQIEDTWNHQFNYPYTFLNEEEFTDEFKDTVRRHASGQCHFVKIPKEAWEKPKNVDAEKQKAGVARLAKNNVQYAEMESYHNMCRFNSGVFYNLPELQKFKWYWRFEPATSYFCHVDYDIFKFMEDNDKTYGFTISLYDDPLTVESLWPVTLEYIRQHPEHVNPNAAFRWLTDSIQNPDVTKKAHGYSTCHFWSNFEVANMDFYRGEAYSKWFERLDLSGGFYYERWGDAPVHSIGVGLFEDKSKVHWFRDIGYHHSPYSNCPNSDRCSRCSAGDFGNAELNSQNCLSNWVKYEMTYSQLQEY